MASVPTRVTQYGLDEPLPERVPLRAGPLTMLFEAGDLRYVRLGDREVVRRLYVAVRDRRWGTVEPVISNLTLDAGERSFRIGFDCRHAEGEVDFTWRGTIVGAEDGAIAYRMDGEARSTFRRNRIGICLLHPVDAAGAPYRLEKASGGEERGTLPEAISPHQPVMDVRALSHQVHPGVWVRFAFEGEVFEMEDQRNWTDASFKTYSTPLALPMPVEVAAGTRIAQSIALTLEGDAAAVAVPTPGPLAVTLGDQEGPLLPPVGFGLTDAPHDERAIERVRELRPAHLYVELALGDAGFPDRLARATAAADAVGAPLELALVLPPTDGGELAALRSELDRLRPSIARWLVFRQGEPTTSAATVAAARAALATYAPGAPFGGGSRTFFTELNRNRPENAAFDLICFPANPQVHAFDVESIVETLPGQAWTVESARRFTGDRPLAIAPITFRSPFKDGPDPRQASLFLAAWTVGSLKYLGEQGVASLTYLETIGTDGLFDGARLFPAYHVFAALAELEGARVVPTVSSDPLRVEALGLRHRAGTTLFVANLDRDEVEVRLPAGGRTRTLDDTSYDPAAVDGLAPGSGATQTGDVVRLRPYAVVRLDLP
jgi:hypothetical protein